MYGDTTIIRHHARTLRGRGDEIRDRAQRLEGRSDGTLWRGFASDEMRNLTHRRTRALRRSADLHDEAAAALERHADNVDRLKGLIAEAERQFNRLVDSAKDVGSKLLDTAKDVASGDFDLEEWVDNFVAPPSGSKAWLDVVLPEG